MTKVDGRKLVDFIEGYYHRKLEKNEILALAEEVKDFTFDDFVENFKFQLLKKVEYFTVAQLHKIIEEYKEIQKFKESLGINSFDELYEN